MISLNINPLRAFLLLLLVFLLLFQTCTPSLAQQYVIANKDVTRPESQTNWSEAAWISMMSAENRNGYNEISWNARRDQDVRSFYVEYSTDAINFQSAGEVSVNANGSYLFKHHIGDPRPMLYRIGMLLDNNRKVHSEAVFLEGRSSAPVRFHPTIVTGNTLNVYSEWPLEKLSVISTAGTEVFQKDFNGQLHHIPVVLPQLSRGMYFVSFVGRGWKHSEKMIIP